MGKGAFRRKIMQNQAGSAALVDISTVRVDSFLAKHGRIAEYVRQMKDPYHFVCGGYDITAKFNDGGPTLEECLQSIMA
jgi:hypothetical protein